MNIISKKHIFLTFSSLLVAVSIAALVLWGLKPGIDFAGGTLWQLSGDKINLETLAKIMPGAVIIPEAANTGYILRFQSISEIEHQDLLARVRAADPFIQELRFETIGPAIGQELSRRALWAFVFVLVGISFYIAFAFRKVSQPVSSWKYGLITLVTLFHDAIIPAGLMAVLGRFLGAEIDTNFVVAILVVMGFSVHDTIVVFDRIRENLHILGGKVVDFNGLVNKSIGETIARSINTSLTLILVLLALYFLGAPALSYFILVILVGTIFGTYSSIFIASPLLTLIR